MNLPTKPDWRDPSTISAAEGWLRLVVGGAFAVILLVMLAAGKIDPSGFIKALLGILAIDRTANGVLSMMRAHNQRANE